MSFGLTSGVITTLGVMMGLNAGTHSKVAVVGGILTIAIADAVSDSFGIHVSEETDPTRNEKQVWESTIAAFIAKFFVVVSFLVPIFFLSLPTAIFVNLVWGMYILIGFSVFIAIRSGRNPATLSLKHTGLALLIVLLTHAVGNWIGLVLN